MHNHSGDDSAALGSKTSLRVPRHSPPSADSHDSSLSPVSARGSIMRVIYADQQWKEGRKEGRRVELTAFAKGLRS